VSPTLAAILNFWFISDSLVLIVSVDLIKCVSSFAPKVTTETSQSAISLQINTSEYTLPLYS
jgi:hypothetical protein